MVRLEVLKSGQENVDHAAGIALNVYSALYEACMFNSGSGPSFQSVRKTKRIGNVETIPHYRGKAM